ncbi:BrnT family toxin [Planktothrix sp. FACHB-1355]|uniref:BrnT family toxin n=1 Tax=Aerosakkonema funiforme FACHB-1375 TaxID=2949571 RepID=A0A926VHU5_9CYAN|nr:MULTISPECIES: BrnT family toxin [Oscillatoriales]MBD2184150.1 BrnT family toxin [Aerosakkonema funiforme FACHB-1375]MBD3558496.1 BrnT family toxin [Planktothrix sp. FACHB-1355]
MEIFDLIFLDSIVEKLDRKHNVQEQEVREIFNNSPAIRFVEKGTRQNENVYAASGQTDSGRYLIVYFIYKQDKNALILSARDMDNAERRRYRNN